MRVLIIEDNQILAKNISKYLDMHWIKSKSFNDWKLWFYEASTVHYDVIILDINLPWMKWFNICSELRAKWKTVPIIMLTSNTNIDDKIKWLNLWADDYLWKPFEYEELHARINALARRDLNNKSSIISHLDVNVNIKERRAIRSGKELKLSKLEIDLLIYLMQNIWIPLKRDEIYEKVWWEFDEFMFSRTVDVYIWYLRKKLWSEFIETKKWYWYLIPLETNS